MIRVAIPNLAIQGNPLCTKKESSLQDTAVTLCGKTQLWVIKERQVFYYK